MGDGDSGTDRSPARRRRADHRLGQRGDGTIRNGRRVVEPGLRGFSIGRGKAQRRLLDISSGPQRWNRVWWSDRGDHLVEIDPIKALEAAMDGFDVADSSTAPTTAERRYAAIEQMPDGVLLANAGHVEAMDLGLTLQARSLAALVDPRTRARRTAISER